MRLIDVKEKFQQEPEKIVEFLEFYGFVDVRIRKTYISFGREVGSSPTGLCLYYDNSYLGYIDFSRNKRGDIFSLIMDYRHKDFLDVIIEAENVLGIEYSFNEASRFSFFGGIYDSLSNTKDDEPDELKKLDETILDKYLRAPNRRFLKDGISLKVQKEFGIRYEEKTGNIIIPVFSPEGYLIGVKARVVSPYRIKSGKYYYVHQCQKNRTLYGYSQNYSKLVGAERVFVFEAEKSVMQAKSFGECRCVAIGGSFLSVTQANLIMSLNPKEVIFAMDKGIPLEKGSPLITNIEVLQRVLPALYETEIKVLDMEDDLLVADKDSPTDNGREEFDRIVEEDLKDWRTIESEINL